VPTEEERLERAVEQGVGVARELGRLPKFADWKAARTTDDSLRTEGQIDRMFESRRGAWTMFQFLIRKELLEDGVDVTPEGRLET
jgi:hypothetical protein